MSAREKRRGRGLWNALLSDPYRKLAAIGLGVGLYYFLDNQVTQMEDVPLTLRAVDPTTRTLAQEQELSRALSVLVPSGLVTVRGYKNPTTGREIEGITLHFEGPKHLIEDLSARTPTFTAGPFQNLRWDEIDGFPFDVEDIHVGDRMLRALKMTMEPPRVEVLLEQNKAEPIALNYEKIEFDFHSNREMERYRRRLMQETASFTHDRVTVRGPASKLEPFVARGQPFKVLLSPKANEREASGSLQLNTDDPALSMEPETVVTVKLSPQQIDYTMEVPVLLDDLSLGPELRGKYVPNEPVQTVRIKVSGPVHARLVGSEEWPLEERRQWARDNLRLVVWIPPPEQNGLVNNVLQARLELVGSLSTIDPIHCTLDSKVAVQLKAR